MLGWPIVSKGDKFYIPYNNWNLWIIESVGRGSPFEDLQTLHLYLASLGLILPSRYNQKTLQVESRRYSKTHLTWVGTRMGSNHGSWTYDYFEGAFNCPRQQKDCTHLCLLLTSTASPFPPTLYIGKMKRENVSCLLWPTSISPFQCISRSGTAVYLAHIITDLFQSHPFSSSASVETGRERYKEGI